MRFSAILPLLLAATLLKASAFAISDAQPLLPRGEVAVLPIAAVGAGPGRLGIVRRDGTLLLVELAKPSVTEVRTSEPAWDLAAAPGGGFWVLGKSYWHLERVGPDGVSEGSHKLSVPADAVAFWNGELVLAHPFVEPDGRLLWKGQPERLASWALRPRAAPGLAAPLPALANRVVLAPFGNRLAVTFRTGKAELVLLDHQGSEERVRLPYFGEPSVPEAEALSSDVESWSKPYSALTATEEGLWGLSGQEGPWAQDPLDRRRGRHVVRLDHSGKVQEVVELPFNAYQIVSDDGKRLLVLDAFLGVWDLARFRKPR